MVSNSEHANVPPLIIVLSTLVDLCSNLYDREQAQQAHWERQEQLLKQQQQQQLLLERQLKQQQQEKLLLMSNMEGSNWPMNHATPAATWTPLGYADWPNQAAMRTSPTHTITPGVGVIRPPPGLESSYNTKNCQLPGTGTAPGTAGKGATLISSNSNNHIDGLVTSHNAQQQQQQDRGQNMPTQYDPFTSPSSIWSDNWRQRNNHMN